MKVLYIPKEFKDNYKDSSSLISRKTNEILKQNEDISKLQHLRNLANPKVMNSKDNIKDYQIFKKSFDIILDEQINIKKSILDRKNQINSLYVDPRTCVLDYNINFKKL